MTGVPVCLARRTTLAAAWRKAALALSAMDWLFGSAIGLVTLVDLNDSVDVWLIYLRGSVDVAGDQPGW
jgi:hypothetical protein